MKNILFILGTGRKNRFSKLAFDFVVKCAKRNKDINVIEIDVVDFPSTFTKGLSKEKNEQWIDLVKQCSGMVIVSPEYNHGYPGELKLLLDSAYQEYKSKPVAICGVSDGPIGGARMAEQLKLVLSAFQMMIINFSVYFSLVNTLFDEKGNIKDEKYWKGKVDGMLNELISYIK
jgi:NAD(P)H-dependent FMN reductase